MKALTLKRRRCLLICASAVAAAAAVLIVFLAGGSRLLFPAAPVVAIETPAKISSSRQEPLSLKLSLSALGQSLYPAASFSIRFDSSHLEFLGISEGNIMTLGGGENEYQLPEWSVDVDVSNESGVINLIYLDITGGKYAFASECLSGEDNVLLSLNFRLRGSARSGDIYELYFDDAVFAASDETKSLAASKGTLRTQNARIVIGDDAK